MISRTAPRLATLLVVGSALLLSACGGNGSATRNANKNDGPLKVTYFEKDSIAADPVTRYFQQTCLSCHATGVGPVITGRNLPPDVVKAFVRNGSRAMPAFPHTMIDDATLDGIAKLVSESTAATGRLPL